MTTKKFKLYFCTLFGGFIFFCLGCAKIGSLSGGEIDRNPPKLDTFASSPLINTNYNNQSLSFIFDENILIEKSELMVISPPLKFKPSLEFKNKKLTFELNKYEILDSTKTYSVELSKVLKDFNEKNEVKKFGIIFSKKNNIDSHTVQTKILNFEDQKPAILTYLCLYENAQDSAIYKSKPSYIGVSDSNGNVIINHIAQGKYQVSALKDLNQNLLFDLSNERIGFKDSSIVISSARQETIEPIYTFAKENPPKIASIDTSFDNRIIINIEPNTAGVQINWLNKNDTAFFLKKDKYFELFYKSSNQKIQFELERIEFKKDTFSFQHKKSKTLKPSIITLSNKPQNLKVFPNEPWILSFNSLIKNVDTTQIEISKNKIPIQGANVQIDKNNPTNLIIIAKWAVDSTYTISFKKGAIIDAMDSTSTLIQREVKVQNPKLFGNLKIKIDSLNSNYNYFINLIKDKEVINSWYISNQADFEKTIILLEPKQYLIQILEDRNKNGKIDSGNYEKRQLPEKSFSSPIEDIRANWTIQFELNLKLLENN